MPIPLCQKNKVKSYRLRLIIPHSATATTTIPRPLQSLCSLHLFCLFCQNRLPSLTVSHLNHRRPLPTQRSQPISYLYRQREAFIHVRRFPARTVVECPWDVTVSWVDWSVK
ncbi:hypothetical protein BC938DRAFT_476566, partial [Jimgerdemannia flammicorona]